MLITLSITNASIGGDLFDGKLTQSDAWTGAENNLTLIGPRSTIVNTANTPNGFRNTGDTPMRSYGVHASPTRTHFGTNTHLWPEWRRATSQRLNWF